MYLAIDGVIGVGKTSLVRLLQPAFGAQGLIPTTSTPAALGEIVARDRGRWAEIVAKRGITPE